MYMVYGIWYMVYGIWYIYIYIYGEPYRDSYEEIIGLAETRLAQNNLNYIKLIQDDINIAYNSSYKGCL